MNNPFMSQISLFFRNNGSELMIYGGVGGAVVSGVMACVKTIHVPEIIAKNKQRLDQVRTEATKETETGESGFHPELIKAYIENGLEYVKLYAAPCIIGGLSVASILCGNRMLKMQNLALAAAYTTLDSSYKKYQERVKERYGEEAEHDIRNDVTTKTVTVEVTDKKGKTHEETKEVRVSRACSDYSVYFEKGTSKAYEPNHEYNMFFLKLQERIANDMLVSNRVVFLNDVYKMLGMEPTRAGQIVGWVYDPDNAEKYKNDNHISFRIQEIVRPGDEFEDDIVETILLDFNVDGPILDHGTEINKL